MSLAFFLGSHTPFNMQRFTRNLANMLEPHFELHLITTDPESLPSEAKNKFILFGGSYPNTTVGEIKSLYDYLQSFSPDVLSQITNPPKHGTIVSLLGKKFEVPTVYRLSGDRFGAYKARKMRDRPAFFAYNNLFGKIPVVTSDYYIVLGKDGRNKLIERGVPEARITILPPAIDQSQFSPNTPPAQLPTVPSDRHIVLFVGRLSRLKGIHTLESVIPDVIDNRKDIHFVFVGEPLSKLDIPQEYEQYVSILGSVQHDKMPSYYNLADALVHPSLTEGLPLVLIEALLCGVPVVARSVGEIPEITQNIFKSEKELLYYLTNVEKIKKESADRFSTEYLSNEYVSFYSSIIN